MSGKHIELFLVDGEPGGIMTANVSGWTGHILVGPRAALTRLLDREEAPWCEREHRLLYRQN